MIRGHNFFWIIRANRGFNINEDPTFSARYTVMDMFDHKSLRLQKQKEGERGREGEREKERERETQTERERD